MDDRYENLKAMQEQLREQMQALIERLNAASRPVHPREYSADFRELQQSMTKLKEAADAFFRSDRTNQGGSDSNGEIEPEAPL